MPQELSQLPQMVFTVEETAAILKVSHKTVYRLIGRNLLKASSALRHKRITIRSIETFLNSTSNGGAL
jgi:excisionase family DNA binding protein